MCGVWLVCGRVPHECVGVHARCVQPLTQEALQSSPAYLELLYQLNTERVKRSDAQKRCDVLEAIAKDLQYKLGVMMADVKVVGRGRVCGGW